MSKKLIPEKSRSKVENTQNKTVATPTSEADEQGPERWSLEAIESAPYGVVVHDADGNILIFNSQLEKISGYDKDEIPDIATWIRKV